MFTIVGSGFGLYGYLPALVEAFGEPVLLPRAYEARVAGRPELQGCVASIRWTADARAAMAEATGIVVATPPRRQEELVRELHRHPALETVILEKPVAVSPERARDVLDELRRLGVRVRIGYTLLHTAWASGLQWPQAGGHEVEITWTFMAHHFSQGMQNWKRSHAQGGGALRFFGVHLLPLLARQGYREVRRSALAGASPDEPELWTAVFSGDAVPDCRVRLDSRSAEKRFTIECASRGLVGLVEPFALEVAARAGDDRRIAVLKRMLATLQSGDDAWSRLYEEANGLWARVEAASSWTAR